MKPWQFYPIQVGTCYDCFIPYLSLLVTTVKRSAYDTLRSNRITGGGGKEFSGGSEMLKQLGEALGLKFPEGFEFPANGRFQGGFGGGFEFTWGE